MNLKRCPLHSVIGLYFFTVVGVAQAAVVELLPAQNTPIYKPKTVITASWMSSSYHDQYRSGHKQSARQYEEQETSVTLSHNTTIAEQTPIVAAISLAKRSVSYQQPLPSPMNGYYEQNEGVSDVRFALGAWPWVDRKAQQHFGVGLVMSLPTGEYDDTRWLNSGENRYRASLVANLKYRLSEKLYSESFMLYNWMSDNTAFKDPIKPLGTLSQAPSTSLTSYLAYHFPHYIQGFVGVEKIMGTDQYLDNQFYSKGQEDLRAYVVGLVPINAQNFLQWRYGKSVAVETGYQQQEQFVLRWMYVL
jgi:hypothetical protein